MKIGRTHMRLLFSSALIGLLFAGQIAHGETAGTSVRIDTGEVVGKFQLNTAVRAFLGVPFCRTACRRSALEARAIGGTVASAACCDSLRRPVHAAVALEN